MLCVSTHFLLEFYFFFFFVLLHLVIVTCPPLMMDSSLLVGTHTSRLGIHVATSYVR